VSFANGDWKALYLAAKRGDVPEVEYWLRAGVDPDMQHIEMGTTPLIVAVEKGHFEVVKALVAGGAGIGVRSDWDQVNAVETAREYGRVDIAEWLERHAAGS